MQAHWAQLPIHYSTGLYLKNLLFKTDRLSLALFSRVGYKLDLLLINLAYSKN